jgi:NTE family protein
VQVNPQRRATEPTSMLDILDRRNELAGNLSLNQEVHAIETINDLLPHLPASRYKRIRVRRIEMTKNLDAASKLDRSPSFINEMVAHGEEKAGEFLRVF